MSDRGGSKLCVLFLTFNRMQYADPCLRSLLDGIGWDGELHVHIADDGSPSGYVDHLRSIAGGYSEIHSVGSSNSDRRGYGANYNLATQSVHAFADYVLVVEDDWELQRNFSVRSLTDALDVSSQGIGCIRLGYLGFTQPLFGDVVRVAGGVYLKLDPRSAEPHVFTGHPRLETVDWQRQQGSWPEGIDPNLTEFEVAYTVRSGIAWPMWLDPDGGSLFSHVGTDRAR